MEGSGNRNSTKELARTGLDSRKRAGRWKLGLLPSILGCTVAEAEDLRVRLSEHLEAERDANRAAGFRGALRALERVLHDANARVSCDEWNRALRTFKVSIERANPSTARVATALRKVQSAARQRLVHLQSEVTPEALWSKSAQNSIVFTRAVAGLPSSAAATSATFKEMLDRECAHLDQVVRKVPFSDEKHGRETEGLHNAVSAVLRDAGIEFIEIAEILSGRPRGAAAVQVRDQLRKRLARQRHKIASHEGQLKTRHPAFVAQIEAIAAERASERELPRVPRRELHVVERVPGDVVRVIKAIRKCLASHDDGERQQQDLLGKLSDVELAAILWRTDVPTSVCDSLEERGLVSGTSERERYDFTSAGWAVHRRLADLAALAAEKFWEEIAGKPEQR